MSKIIPPSVNLRPGRRSRQMVLPDLLEPGLKLVFCGTAPGYQSAQREAYYAGTGNLFYPTLAKCGFSPAQLEPKEYPALLTYGIGLTDLVKTAFGMDSDLEDEDYDTAAFKKKILKYQPRFVCFNGKQAAHVYFNLKSTRELSYGIQRATIGKTTLFVAPSTSRRAAVYWDEQYWRQLKGLVG